MLLENYGGYVDTFGVLPQHSKAAGPTTPALETRAQTWSVYVCTEIRVR